MNPNNLFDREDLETILFALSKSGIAGVEGFLDLPQCDKVRKKAEEAMKFYYFVDDLLNKAKRNQALSEEEKKRLQEEVANARNTIPVGFEPENEFERRLVSEVFSEAKLKDAGAKLQNLVKEYGIETVLDNRISSAWLEANQDQLTWLTLARMENAA
jgi:sugar phosphate isomerase/epimerase